MPDPRVTVAIPSFNHGRWLPVTIESVLGQTYPNVELLVVDDGSSDRSLEIAERYAAADPGRVRVFTHADGGNHGISATLNVALTEANGAYWSVLDGDDVLLPHKVEREVALLEADSGLVFVYAMSQLIDADGGPIPGARPWGLDICGAQRPLERLVASNVIPNITGLARLSVLRQPPAIRYGTSLVYGDWDFWLRVASRGRIAFVPELLAQSRIHGANTTAGVETEAHRVRCIAVLESVRADVDALGGALAVPATRAALELELAFLLLENGQREEAEPRLEAAFAVDPSLDGDRLRLERWLDSHGHRGVPGTPDAYLAAARWVASGRSADPPPGLAPGAHLDLWLHAHAPAATRAALAEPLARVQRVRAALAAGRQGEVGRARGLAARCLVESPSLLRSDRSRGPLVRLVLGPRLAGLARRLGRR
jgi:hypothetical protein